MAAQKTKKIRSHKYQTIKVGEKVVSDRSSVPMRKLQSNNDSLVGITQLSSTNATLVSPRHVEFGSSLNNQKLSKTLESLKKKRLKKTTDILSDKFSSRNVEI